MSRRIRNVTFAAVFLAVGAPFSAWGNNGYVSLLGGYVVAQDQDAGLLEDITFDEGFLVGGALGYEYPYRYLNLNVEGEVAYRRSPLDEARFLGTVLDADGQVSVLSFMVNAHYLFLNRSVVTPFVTVGVGGTWTNINDAEVNGVTVVDDDEVQFAYQLGGGLEFALGKRVAANLGYRYFSTSKDSFENEIYENFDFRYSAHEFYLGLRFLF